MPDFEVVSPYQPAGEPQKTSCFWGTPFDFICSGQVNWPGIKVLSKGQDACTRHPPRPAFAGADPRLPSPHTKEVSACA